MSMSGTNTTHRSSSISSSSAGESSTQHLAEIVVTAAQSNQKSSNIVQLRISNMQLHGRDDDIKLLRGKLRELAKKKDVDAAEENNKHEDTINNLYWSLEHAAQANLP
ncbi:hypothetical protein QTG54_010533 [Skeletonema marinoi]|uniref:Uncharacterized protein n=1 Tax=Skeletonema marinoi TaxID=267567 RepID=A0AAD8Y2T8_9STRA|nr:hypothetical protein QTG54_010533 [Skeletonema marinoi]